MITTSNCCTRRCTHYLGIDSDGVEINERHYCEAYPKGIPSEIAFGQDKHLKVRADQKNEIVYEKFKE